jgi:geranylgeranyl diphosphate synthase type II
LNQNARYQEVYTRERRKIDEKLNKVCLGKNPVSLFEPVDYSLGLSGKRLRPFLVLLSAHAAGSSFSSVYNAALAVEMLHTFTLVHDDIMDNADLRRKFPTLHKKYDLSTAILAGDVLLAIAYQYLLKDAGADANRITAQFTHGLIEVCEGQALDKEFESRKSVSLDEYLIMITKKTAVLVETCCAIGAMLAGADMKVVNGLKRFGLNLGIAFQIQDDLLDIIGNEKEFGKKIGGDLIEGKKTYLFLTALHAAKGKNQKALQAVIKNKGVAPEQISMYRKIYEDVGAIDIAKRAIVHYTELAVNSLKVLPDSHDKKMFVWLSDLLIKRTY